MPLLPGTGGADFAPHPLHILLYHATGGLATLALRCGEQTSRGPVVLSVLLGSRAVSYWESTAKWLIRTVVDAAKGPEPVRRLAMWGSQAPCACLPHPDQCLTCCGWCMPDPQAMGRGGLYPAAANLQHLLLSLCQPAHWCMCQEALLGWGCRWLCCMQPACFQCCFPAQHSIACCKTGDVIPTTEELCLFACQCQSLNTLCAWLSRMSPSGVNVHQHAPLA